MLSSTPDAANTFSRSNRSLFLTCLTGTPHGFTKIDNRNHVLESASSPLDNPAYSPMDLYGKRTDNLSPVDRLCRFWMVRRTKFSFLARVPRSLTKRCSPPEPRSTGPSQPEPLLACDTFILIIFVLQNIHVSDRTG